MTVSELIERLRKENGDAIVVMAKDSEGNGYSPLSDYWCGAYRAETTYSGEVGFGLLTAELEKEGYTVEDVIEDGEDAVILCPTN